MTLTFWSRTFEEFGDRLVEVVDVLGDGAQDGLGRLRRGDRYRKHGCEEEENRTETRKTWVSENL